MKGGEGNHSEGAHKSLPGNPKIPTGGITLESQGAPQPDPCSQTGKKEAIWNLNGGRRRKWSWGSTRNQAVTEPVKKTPKGGDTYGGWES